MKATVKISFNTLTGKTKTELTRDINRALVSVAYKVDNIQVSILEESPCQDTPSENLKSKSK